MFSFGDVQLSGGGGGGEYAKGQKRAARFPHYDAMSQWQGQRDLHRFTGVYNE